MQLTQLIPLLSNIPRLEAPLLGLEDLQPCMAFRNLHCIALNVECNVGLTDNQVLILASAWPKLEHFLINAGWGWNSPGGITLGGLVQLLQICWSLYGVTLALDTRGYTESCSSIAPAILGLMLPR